MMTKITGLTELTTMMRGDILACVDTSALSTKKILVENAIKGPGLLVAANDAPDQWKKHADYVCDGTSDESEIQSAIGALPSGGGQVNLSPGTFTVAKVGTLTDDSITSGYCVKVVETDPPVAITGVPGSTIVKLADTQDANSVPFLIRGKSTAERTNPTFIYGIEFDGNASNQVASWTDFGLIGLLYCDQVRVENCRFHDWPRNGLHAFRDVQKLWVINNYFYDSDGSGGARIENMFYVVQGNIFDAAVGLTTGATLQLPPDADLTTPQTSRAHVINGNTFLGGFNQLHGQGLQAASIVGNVFANVTNAIGRSIIIQHASSTPAFDADSNVIVANTFYNIANAIRLNGSGSNGALRNLVSFNAILDGPDATLNYGIQEDGGTSDYNRILFNQIDASASNPVVTAGSNTVAQGNQGYTTENKGAAASTADGGTIAHGCDATPTYADVQATVAGEIATVTSIDATNITVAIKDNAGSPGTTQTIYWSAEV